MFGNFGLKINEDVLAKMAGMAAEEVEGVSTVAVRSADIKGLVNRGSSRGVNAAVSPDGEITLDIHISVAADVKVRDAAAAVQKNVKEKVQNMTGSAVNRVNVRVEDVVFPDVQPENA